MPGALVHSEPEPSHPFSHLIHALQEMADEVLESIMESFRYPDQDTAWHGGCLALAEVARRGLLLPRRVPELAPLISTALQYDLRRGAHRYLCWHPLRLHRFTVVSV